MSTVKFSIPIDLMLVVLFEGGNEVVSIVASDLFNAKVIKGECELYWARSVFPESWCGRDFVVSMWL